MQKKKHSEIEKSFNICFNGFPDIYDDIWTWTPPKKNHTPRKSLVFPICWLPHPKPPRLENRFCPLSRHQDNIDLEAVAELAELAEEEEFLGHQKSPWKFPHGQFIGNLDSVVRISKLWYLLAGKHMKRHHLGRIFYCWHGHLHGYLQTWPMIVL